MIKQHMIKLMNELIGRVNRITIAQKTLMGRTWNRVSKIEMKIEQMEKYIKDTIDFKIEEDIDNLFDNDEKFESKTSYRKSRMRSNLYSKPKILHTTSDRFSSTTRMFMP